ncbi:MAG: hypothetical protein HYW26_01745 [Candidatus Aenigmarchaeota archaeon]|nr:hypothetical protein [Candidatus Aenigmarchaeota archaeon]
MVGMVVKIGAKLRNGIKTVKRRLYTSRSKSRFVKAAGSWKNVNAEKLKKKIYSSRKIIEKEF